MRTLFALVFSAVAFLSCSQSPDRFSESGLRAVTPSLVKQHVDFLASDSLKGRNTPSPGLDTAARYIAREFSRLGFQGVRGGHLQRLSLNIVSLGDTNLLRISVKGMEKGYAIKEDFTPFEMTASKQVSASVVFCGYGISAPEFGYDDYAGVDVRGKVVFVLRHEPREEDSAAVFEGRKATDYSNVARKVKIAREHGAAAVLVATDPLNHTSLTPRGFPWPSLSKFLPKDALPVTLGIDEKDKVPVVQVGEKVIVGLFGSVDSLRALQSLIDSTMKPRSFAMNGTTANVRTTTRIQMVPADNVVGFLEGSDPSLKNEIVVVGAHYDHVGTARNPEAGKDSIYNGADDNASGTAALMGVAAGFHASGKRPARSILLIAFAGEEKGLFGSEYYVRNPLFPLESTVAMVNLDMVGRNSRDSLSVIGGKTAPELLKIAQQENSRVGFVLVDEKLSSGGSDHMSFERKGIPALFLHSGLHPEYHQLTDHADLINNDKAAAAAQLAYLIAFRLANDPQRYSYVKP